MEKFQSRFERRKFKEILNRLLVIFIGALILTVYFVGSPLTSHVIKKGQSLEEGLVIGSTKVQTIIIPPSMLKKVLNIELYEIRKKLVLKDESEIKIGEHLFEDKLTYEIFLSLNGTNLTIPYKGEKMISNESSEFINKHIQVGSIIDLKPGIKESDIPRQRFVINYFPRFYFNFNRLTS